MATTVGQHSVATFTSPVNGTTPIDANTVRGNDNTIRVAYVDHDADTGIHVQSSTLATRPVAGVAGRKWITEDSGVYTLWFDDGTNWHPVSSENVALTVLATTALTKGDVVKVTGWNNGQDLPEVAKVSSSSDVAFAVMSADCTINTMGYATNTGILQDINTNSFTVGTTLYPSTSGGFTSTKPTSGLYQVVGYVLRQNSNNGVVFVEFSAPRIVEASANTASTVVQRDASGNFSAGTVSVGALTSTGLVTFASLKGTGATTVTNILDEDNMASDSATALATQQSIKAYVDTKVATVDTLAEVLANGNTTGATDIVVNSGQKIRTPAVAAQDGTASITIANSTGALTLNTALADSNLATISTAGKVSNSATTATNANTASAIVARDASGNFSAGTITASLTGNVTGNVSGSSGSTTGNAATATALQTARTINGTSFDGTANITVTAAAGTLTGSTLASGVTASSLTSVGTLSSLTVTGDVTVGTSKFKVDTTNTRIGIGTASPLQPVHAYKASGTVLMAMQSGTTYGYVGNDGTNVFLASGSGATGIKFTVNLTAPDSAWGISSSGHLLAGTDATYDIGASGATRPRNIYTSGDATIAGVTVGRGAGAVSSNTAVGASALNANTTGVNSTAVGFEALAQITTNGYGVAIGYRAAKQHTGNYITVVGTLAGGNAANSNNSNTLVGYAAGYSTTGISNTFVGAAGSTGLGCGELMTSGNYNTILGAYSGNADGLDIRTSSNRVVIADGQGNRQLTMYEGGTVALDSAVPAAGTGITFPATQSASTDANTLDDYEEGTWTPSLGGNATYTNQQGTYRKIGQLVFIQCYLNINTIGTGSTTTISGLPFTSLSIQTAYGMSPTYFANLANNVLVLAPKVNSAATTVGFNYNNTAGATFTGFDLAVFGDSARVDFTGCYLANA